jgi:signal transduction histidine kinase
MCWLAAAPTCFARIECTICGEKYFRYLTFLICLKTLNMPDKLFSDSFMSPAQRADEEASLLLKEVAQLRKTVSKLIAEAATLRESGTGAQSGEILIRQLRSANQNLLLATFGAQDRQATAEAANHAKEEFLAMLAHELRNPLAPITMAAALLGKVLPADPQLPKIHEIICRQTNHLSRLVDDLLDASRVSSGKITLQKKVILLSQVIAAALETVQPLIEKRHQELIVDLPVDPVPIDGDPVRLSQAFSNLLINASKFSPEHKAIWLTARTFEGALSLSVKDEGIGIAPEIAPLIFDLFTQGAHALDRAQGGLGIGLTLVRTIINLHGGTVTVHSEGTGFGSEFVVTLPISSTPLADEISVPSKPTKSRLARILIIEDNGDSNETLKNFLTLEGYSVQSATNGIDGLAMAQTNRYDVIICDIGLPGMDGYEVVTRLRHWLKPVPCFIAVTGYNQLENRIRAIEVGFDHYLVKPVALDILLNVISLGVRA